MNFKTTTTFIIILLISGAVYFFTSIYFTNQRTNTTFHDVNHTYIVIEEIHKIKTSLLDMESQVRGYVISGNPVFLSSFSAEKTESLQKLNKLKALTVDNPKQQTHLEQLDRFVHAKLGFQEKVLSTYQRSPQEALVLISSLKGKAITDNVRAVFEQMLQEEHQLLQLRIAANTSITNKKFLFSILIGVAGFTLFVFALLKISKEYKGRKVAEQLSKANEAKYKGLIENSGVGIYSADLKGRFVFVSNQCIEITGFQAAALIGRHFESLIRADKREEVAQFYNKQYREEIKETLLQFPIQTKEGYTKWVEQSTVLIRENGVPVGFQCIVKDITENKLGEGLLKETELRLRAEQEENQFRLQAILDNIPMVVYIKDLEGRFVMVNKRFKEDLGMTEAMILGRTNRDVNKNDAQADIYIESDKRVIETLQPVEFEEVLITNSGERHMLVTKFPLFDKNNQLFAISGVDKDITDMVRSRQQLIDARLRAEKAEKLQEEFLANMSHEIRTPMNGIIGMTHLLYETDLTKDQREFVQIVKQSSDSLLMLINDILDLSKIKAGRMTVEAIDFSILSVIDTVVAPLQLKAREKQLLLKKKVQGEGIAIVKGDQYKLAQVLNNLIGNAVKFTEQGEISVEVNSLKADEQTVTVEFIVSDTGIGIGPEHLDYIFESFTQAGNDMVRRYGGTGLGLAITRRLIELQGGHIEVKSTLGVGTCFRFEITYSKGSQVEALARKGTDAYTERKCLKGKKVLLVEDNEINQRVTCLHLQKGGLVIDIANNGKEAVDILEGGKAYDLIIMDLQMPEMNGFQTTMYIRQKLAIKTPIIAMTASALRNERTKCFEVGMNEYMTKPFVPAELFSHIEQLLEGSISKTANQEIGHKEKASGDLYSLSYILEMEDQDYLVEVLQLFVDSTPEMLHTIQQAVIYESWEEVYKTAHKLKSSLGIFQMTKMVEGIGEIERLAKYKEQLDLLPELINDLLVHYNLIRPMLEADLVKAKNFLN